MKIVGPRQNPVSSPDSSQSGSLLKDALGGGKKDGVSGAALKTGGGHTDNCQTVAHDLKKDGYELGKKLGGKLLPHLPRSAPLSNRNSSGSGRSHSDNVMLGYEKPRTGTENGGFNPQPGTVRPGTKWQPIKIGGGHADNVFKGDTLTPKDSSQTSLTPSSSRLGGILGKLLHRLFPHGFPGKPPVVVDRGDKPGSSHGNNVLMNAPPPLTGPQGIE